VIDSGIPRLHNDVMSDELRRAEDLFNLARVHKAREGEPLEPEPVPEPPRRRARLVRNLDAVRAAKLPSTADTLARDAVALDAQAAELKKRLAEARSQLRVPERQSILEPAPARLPPLARASAPAPIVTPEPALPLHQWCITVTSRATDSVFFLSAKDAVDAASDGAREIAAWMRDHRPGEAWRVSSVERLSAVL